MERRRGGPLKYRIFLKICTSVDFFSLSTEVQICASVETISVLYWRDTLYCKKGGNYKKKDVNIALGENSLSHLEHPEQPERLKQPE